METPVTFKNKKGLPLVGMLHMPESGKSEKTVIICHGFGGTKTQKMFVETARALVVQNFCVLRFDFTGHGDSQGAYKDYSIKNEIGDLECAVKFLETFETINTENIGLMGHSLGAAISVMYAKENKYVKSLVLLAPALNLRELMLLWYTKRQIYDLKFKGQIDIEEHTITKEFFDEAHETDLTCDLKELVRPTLMIHGKEDETIPVEYTTAFLKEESETFKIEILENVEHKFKDLKSRETIKNKTVEWFEKWMQ
ncbi:MAG: alpha/beta fold hydrolase [Candidatus Aenigmarchaeota archaeon]|nr:alpha/beta fold hydrolase [Candidatus Aenigmarchaeota archaeon]